MHKGSFSKAEMFRDKYLDTGDNLLIVELGGLHSSGSCCSVFENKNWKYKGVDIKEGKGADIVVADYYDTSNQIMSSTVDVVVSGQTFERIPYFWKTFEDISRMLIPGGLLCLVVASSGGYDLSGDFYRIYSGGLVVLSEMVGLKVHECVTDNAGMWRDTYLVARKPALSKPKRYVKAIKEEDSEDGKD